MPLATFFTACFAAWYAFAQAKTARDRHEAQTEADRQRLITESFAKAIEQLGSDKLEIRLGGIYTLERIAAESDREYWPIMETLTAFVRERAPWPPRQAVANPFVHLQGNIAARAELDKATDIQAMLAVVRRYPELDPGLAEPVNNQAKPATDIQAILTVLGRRSEEQRKQHQGRWLELGGTNLRGADLTKAHLEQTDLTRAHLGFADLWGAHLEGAILCVAHLEDADFREAHLDRADLTEAHLDRADLWGAHLNGACLREAQLENTRLGRAHLEGADLTAAVGLTQEDLHSANGDDQTILPVGLTRPAHWSKSEGRDNEPQQ